MIIGENMTKVLIYIAYRDDNNYLLQCLNVEVSSFSDTAEDAINNLNEALSLYLEGKDAMDTIIPVHEALMGETHIDV